MRIISTIKPQTTQRAPRLYEDCLWVNLSFTKQLSVSIFGISGFGPYETFGSYETRQSSLLNVIVLILGRDPAQNTIGSLGTRVFETRTATGREHFAD